MPRKGKTNLLGEASASLPQGQSRDASAEQSELSGEATLGLPQGQASDASARQPNGDTGHERAADKASFVLPASPPSDELPSEATVLMLQGQRSTASAGQPLDQRIASQQEFAVQRRLLNRAKLRVLSQAMAITRRALGWYAGDNKDAREGMNKRAKSIVDNYFAGRAAKPEDAEIVAALAVQLDVWREMMAPSEKRIALVEKEMTIIAATLPGYGFVQSVPGFGVKTFAIIVGEAGDLGGYPKKGHLWKRLGLAPYQKNGVTKACSQWAKEGGLDKDDWIAAGYKRDRRADIFICLGQRLIMGNGNGKYRTAYLARKEYERVRAEASGLTVAPAGKIPKGRSAEFMSLGHIDRRAQRYMEKLAIRDLWRAWRDEQRASLPVPETAKKVVPVAHPDEEKAIVRLPQEAIIDVSSPQPNEEKANADVPPQEASFVLPSPQPNAAEVSTDMPERGARVAVPPPQKKAA